MKYNLTDLGNARRMIGLFGKDLKYCKAWKCWMIWDGTRWIRDNTDEIVRKAKQTVEAIRTAGMENENLDMIKFAEKSESRARINAMISLAQSEPSISVTPGQFDTDIYKINLLNGTIDLSKSGYYKHNKNDLLTKITNVEGNENATYPRWSKFINEIFANDVDLIEYVQKVVGYSLTGDTSEQCLFFLYGNGANGKSVFVETIQEILGSDYVKTTPTETLWSYPALVDRFELSTKAVCAISFS